MAISDEEVRKIATLARISLKEGEVKKFAAQLGSILEYMKILSEVDTSKTAITAQVIGLTNVLRPDTVSTWVEREALLGCSPLPIEDHHIKVPPLFDES